MIKKPTQKDLTAQVVQLSMEHQLAHLAVQRRRLELNAQYRAYFAVYGEPEPNFRGIRWEDPRYAGVISHTDGAYELLRKAKQKRYTVKRRLETAVRKLMTLTGVSLDVPAEACTAPPLPVPVRRFTPAGETLQ